MHSLITILLWAFWPVAWAANLTENTPANGVDSMYFEAEISAIASSGQYAPSLLHANRRAMYSNAPFSGTLAASVFKPALAHQRWFDYDFGANLTGYLHSPLPNENKIAGTGFTNLFYAHARVFMFDFTAGIQPTEDRTIVGDFLFSRNAHPMPRVSVGIDQYTPFPGLFGYVDIRGGMAHYWQSPKCLVAPTNPAVYDNFIHHKYVGVQLNIPASTKVILSMSYEFHHAVQWGGYSAKYGDLGNDWSAFKNAFMALGGGTVAMDQTNAQGNHIASQRLAMNIHSTPTDDGTYWFVRAYWQNINEDGPIRFMGMGMNPRDGIWGVQVKQKFWRFISEVHYELLNTTDQSGPYHDKDGYVYGGQDNYYQNGIYSAGWTYWGASVGAAMVVPQNSRVHAHFILVKGDIYGYEYCFVSAISKHYGTYRNPSFAQNTGLLLEVDKRVYSGLTAGIRLACDIGTLFGPSYGAELHLKVDGAVMGW